MMIIKDATVIDHVARALYDHWRAEAELHGDHYVHWDELPDKQTWRGRALTAIDALITLYVPNHAAQGGEPKP